MELLLEMRSRDSDEPVPSASMETSTVPSVVVSAPSSSWMLPVGGSPSETQR